MKRLIHPQRVPYNSPYRINRPDLGMVGTGSQFDQLETDVRIYRKANGIPTGLGFSQELETLLCSEYPDECNETDPNLPPTKPRRHKLSEVIAGTKLMVSFWAKGKPTETLTEATRRAKICSTCKYNTHFPLPCSGHCGDLSSIVKSLIGNQTTPYESELKSCALCGCYLTASVWVPLDLQWKVLSDAQRNQFRNVEWCWKRMPEQQ